MQRELQNPVAPVNHFQRSHLPVGDRTMDWALEVPGEFLCLDMCGSWAYREEVSAVHKPVFAHT